MTGRTQSATDAARRILAAAARVHEAREWLVPSLVAATGLSAEGVALGFESLERDASDDDLALLVRGAIPARHVHVVLAANVFVAAVRALALAVAAAPRVTLRPSPREDVLVRALVAALDDPEITLVDERDVARVGADQIHAYGRDATIQAIRAAAPAGTLVRGHGAGLGVAWISRDADPSAAAADLGLDVVAFDQRGCLSPRLVLVEGDAARGAQVADALHEALVAFGRRVPRGALDASEVEDARHWSDALAFSGMVWRGSSHLVGLAPPGAPLLLPPAGRHVHVAAVKDAQGASALLAPLASAIVAVGSDDPDGARAVAPRHARFSSLGRMQRPPLDGPVDQRADAS